MTRDEYNKKVRTMQEVWPEQMIRLRKLYDRSDRLTAVYFEVYFDRWRHLGTQQFPFEPFAQYYWNEDEEIRAMARLTAGITSDRAEHWYC